MRMYMGLDTLGRGWLDAILNDRNRIANEKLISIIGLYCISGMLRRGRLKWLGHVENVGRRKSEKPEYC